MTPGWTPIVVAGKKAKTDLVRLVYVSSASPDLTSDDLEAIARRSRAQNESAGLTGLLLHRGPYFYGVLEGGRRHVFARMEEIITDRRHSRLRILREEPISSRRFDNWSFGMLPVPHGGTVTAPEDFIWNFARRLR